MEPVTTPKPQHPLLDFFARHRRAFALLSFAGGLASFLLIQRAEGIAKGLAIVLLLSWLAMLLEKPLTRGRLPAGLLRFLVQAVHQETFFFVLPFFFLTTTWNTPQAVFTVLLTVAGLASMWDPLYFRVIAARRPLYLAFHALAIFVAMLVALPIIVHLTTAQSLGIAAAAVALLAVPGLASVLDRQKLWHRALLVLGAVALGAVAWFARPFVPPATLWVADAAVSARVDRITKEPGVRLITVTPAHLHQHGLYAWTAIHAPRGLSERVFHRWLQNGVEVDRIPLEIVGGRGEGYRAWSHKQGFPADPRGGWHVEVLTEGGQLIGKFPFGVVGLLPAEMPAPPLSDEAPVEPEQEAPVPAEPEQEDAGPVPPEPGSS